MRRITAKYDGECRWCGTPVRQGEGAWWQRGQGVGHINCRPSGDRRADNEYWAGRAEGQRYSDEVQIYGRELAEQFAVEDELARWNAGEDY